MVYNTDYIHMYTLKRGKSEILNNIFIIIAIICRLLLKGTWQTAPCLCWVAQLKLFCKEEFPYQEYVILTVLDVETLMIERKRTEAKF